jgi:hypothetical protein
MVLSFNTNITAISKLYKQFTTVPLRLVTKGTGSCMLYIPKMMTLNTVYNHDHTDEAIFYVDCHDITQYIFMENLKMEMGIKNDDLRILST